MDEYTLGGESFYNQPALLVVIVHFVLIAPMVWVPYAILKFESIAHHDLN